LQLAAGDFIAFFDDDDESFPERIRKQVDLLLAYEARHRVELVACYASGIRRYSNGYVKSLPAIGSRGRESPRGRSVADYLFFFSRRQGWYYGSGTPACSLMARRSTFLAVGGFDSSLRRVEDADFAVRLALLDGHFIGTTENLFVQYATAGTDKTYESNLAAERGLIRKHKRYLQSIGRYEYALRWPRLRYWHFKRRYGRFVLEFAQLFLRYPMAVTFQLLVTGPRRLLHEARVRWSN
jgi:glycosyltransferase involved in cell wall biosynthesis